VRVKGAVNKSFMSSPNVWSLFQCTVILFEGMAYASAGLVASKLKSAMVKGPPLC